MTEDDDELGAWLGTHGAPADPNVSERVFTLTRALRPEVVDVDGRTVLRATDGVAFAAVEGRRLLVRTNDAPGTLDTSPIDGLAGWLALDAWPSDVGFRRGTDVLRDVLRDAWTRA